MERRSSRLVAVLLLAFATGVAAYEPPGTGPVEALESGQIAFVGRVVGITEIDHSPHLSNARVTFEITEVFYGLESNPGDRVALECRTRWYLVEPGFGLELRISESLLVVLGSRSSEPDRDLSFRSSYPAIDLAFRLPDDPRQPDGTLEGPLHLTSAYGGWEGTVEADGLRLAAKRRRQDMAGTPVG